MFVCIKSVLPHYRKQLKVFMCSTPCIKISCIKKPTNVLVNYIRCLLTTPTCFGRLLRPSSGCIILKNKVKVVCGQSIQDMSLQNVTKF